MIKQARKSSAGQGRAGTDAVEDDLAGVQLLCNESNFILTKGC